MFFQSSNIGAVLIDFRSTFAGEIPPVFSIIVLGRCEGGDSPFSSSLRLTIPKNSAPARCTTH